MTGEAYTAAAAVRGVRGARLPRGRALRAEEWRRLFVEVAHERSPVRERDAALVALAYAGGFRRAREARRQCPRAAAERVHVPFVR